MKGTFHIHTKYSFDTLLSPANIVRHLKLLGFDFAAITDHDTIKGAVEASLISDIPIIIGAEYFTDKGDIIGLFLTKEIETRESNEVIAEIRKQGGVVVLPHPCREHKLDEELLSSVDIIEIFNSKCSSSENKQAEELALKYKKPGIAGSDAHFLNQIGLTEITLGNTKDIKSALSNGDFKITKTVRAKPYHRIGTGSIRLYKVILMQNLILRLIRS